MFGSVRWRYFGPRALVEDDSVRSKATSLVNLTAGYKITPSVRLALDVFNLFNRATATSTTSTRRACQANPPAASKISTRTRQRHEGYV